MTQAASIAPPPWRGAFSRFALIVKLGFPVLTSGSNCAVKPTRLRRAAYFHSLAISNPFANPLKSKGAEMKKKFTITHKVNKNAPSEKEVTYVFWAKDKQEAIELHMRAYRNSVILSCVESS